jgi:MoaA/NifB/PqqE/SkfB family radical SAM enzyme
MQVEELYNELKDEGFAKILIAEVKGILDYGVRVPLCFPGSVSWEITYKCNLKCLHCYVESPRVVDELSTDEALKVVRDIAEMGFV